MRKFLLALTALIGLSSAAQAHVSAVPYPEIGSLEDVTHKAAFDIFQTALPSGAARTQVNLTCGGTDDTAAFLAFKAAWQGTTPVQLNLPAGTCVFNPGGGGSSPNFYAFKGIQDLIVNGQGTGSTTFNVLSGQLGGSGQFQDNAHSMRTNDAAPGDSCVTLKTPPSVTISAADNNLPNPASFTAMIPVGATYTGTQTGTTLTVTAASGTIKVGGFLRQAGGTASPARSIVAQLTGTGGAPCPDATCTGGVGTYSVSVSTSNGSDAVTGNVLNVTAVGAGTIPAGANLMTGVTNGISGIVTVQPYGTGGTSGTGTTGTYALSSSASVITSSSNVRTTPASFTASVDAVGVMTVSAVADGTIAVGMYTYRNGGGTNGQIKSQLTGTGGAPCPDVTCNGGIGTYKLAAPPSAAQSSAGYLGNGQIRLTLNSTAGITSGDTVYFTGLTGTGVLPQRVNGLQWVKVINGTQLDLFQQDFNGGYTSGGTGGGDRTSLYPNGSKVMMAGWTNQAYWAAPQGYPSNPQWFEYKTVASSNSGTHQVCFDTTLANTYKSTWPQYNIGNQFEVDQGGPATLYVLDPSWEMTAVFQNFTLASSAQVYANGRNITYSNVATSGGLCMIPTQNETHTWTSVAASSCNIETDKIVGTWNMTNSSARIVHVQSSSIDTMNLNNVTVLQWAGTPKKFFAIDLTTTGGSLQFGSANYGASEESSCTNCTSSSGVTRSTPITRVDYPGFEWSMSGGVITIPNALSYNSASGAQNPGGELQTRGLVPGSYNFWSGAGGGGSRAQTGRAFKVVDVTQDLDNTYVQTSEAGGFPTGTWTTSGLSVFPHPAARLTPVNWTGDNTVIAFNGCPAQSPMYSCASFVHTGGASGTSTFSVPLIWGELDTFTFTNNVPYTGAGSLGWTISQFGQMPYLKTDNTQALFGVSIPSSMINAKLPSSCGSCTRTLDQAHPSGSNTQVGDSLTAPPAGAVFGGSTSAVFTANTPSDSPQVTVTLKTNQHLP